MKRLFLFIIPILHFTILSAQVRISDNIPLVDVEVKYDPINRVVNFSILNKEETTIFINDNASYVRNGSKVYITLLDSGQSDDIVGEMNIYGLGKTASTIELNVGKKHKYSYDVKDQISSHQSFNRIRVEYNIQYYTIKDKVYEVKRLKGKKILYK